MPTFATFLNVCFRLKSETVCRLASLPSSFLSPLSYRVLHFNQWNLGFSCSSNSTKRGKWRVLQEICDVTRGWLTGYPPPYTPFGSWLIILDCQNLLSRVQWFVNLTRSCRNLLFSQMKVLETYKNSIEASWDKNIWERDGASRDISEPFCSVLFSSLTLILIPNHLTPKRDLFSAVLVKLYRVCSEHVKNVEFLVLSFSFFCSRREKPFTRSVFVSRSIQRFQLALLDPSENVGIKCKMRSNLNFLLAHQICTSWESIDQETSPTGLCENPNLLLSRSCFLSFSLTLEVFIHLLNFERGRQKRNIRINYIRIHIHKNYRLVPLQELFWPWTKSSFNS
jgi:hypothetical protein